MENAILSLVCYPDPEGMPSPTPTLLFGRFEPLAPLYEVPGIALWSCRDQKHDRECIGVALSTAPSETAPDVSTHEPLSSALLEPVAQGVQELGLAASTTPAFWLVYAAEPQTSLWHHAPDDLESRLQLLVAVARALTLSHRADQAHGWLHPALVGSDQHGVWLAGLHSVALHQQLERSAEPWTTSEPRLAPELRSNARVPVTPACDAFSLGVLASELLAPFPRPASAGRLLEQAQSHSVSERPEDLLQWTDALRTSMLSAKPRSYPTGRALGVGLLSTPLFLLLAAWVGWRIYSTYLRAPTGQRAPLQAAATLPEAATHGRPRGGLSNEPSFPEKSGSTSPNDARALVPVPEGAPIWGDSEALVTAVLFGDLNCPFTRYTVRALTELKDEMPHDLRLVFRHRPMTPAGRSLGAAAARLYATHGGPAFFRFSWLLSQESHAVGPDFLRAQQNNLGLTPREVDQLLATSEAPRLEEDSDWALRYEVFKVPTLFVNGRRVEGLMSQEQLTKLILEERRAQISLLAQGVSRDTLYEHRVRNTFAGLDTKPPERHCVPTAGRPSTGPDQAPIEIVEFSDFECSYCAQLEGTLQRVRRTFPGKVRLAWLNFPLETHPNARTAANLALHAWEAGSKAQFWQLHHALLKAHEQLGPASYQALLKRVGLDVDSYLDAANSGAHDSIIDADLRLAEKLGVDGVPTLFINGRKLEGARDFKVVQAVVREELRAMQRYEKTGLEAHSLDRALCTPR